MNDSFFVREKERDTGEKKESQYGRKQGDLCVEIERESERERYRGSVERERAVRCVDVLLN